MKFYKLFSRKAGCCNMAVSYTNLCCTGQRIAAALILQNRRRDIYECTKSTCPTTVFSFPPPGRSGLSIFILQQWVTCYFPTCRISSLNKKKLKMQLLRLQVKPPMYAQQKYQTEHHKLPAQSVVRTSQ